ncbi:hypothetical protein FNV43_RR13615 [Rhamnella rubrinervis]|uniref:Uncharacterized protein n=1 Tax=Rhamnella rubrinervis TaxID=2594499 RepID=A0A8K0H1L9_9ROSA|nr:hypothetical protein FNV43_RR13615 [Rhamnella rubrinervis]
MQDYLKEYIRLMGAEDLQAVQPVKTNQIAATAAAPANEVPTTNLTTRRFRNQPSTATDIDRVPFTKSHKPGQPLVLDEFDKGEKPKGSDPPRKQEEKFQTAWTILGTGSPSSRTWHETAVLNLGEGRTNSKKFTASTENNKFTDPTKNNNNFTVSTLSNRNRLNSY